jgi:hypothetical protein
MTGRTKNTASHGRAFLAFQAFRLSGSPAFELSSF